MYNQLIKYKIKRNFKIDENGNSICCKKFSNKHLYQGNFYELNGPSSISRNLKKFKPKVSQKK